MYILITYPKGTKKSNPEDEFDDIDPPTNNEQVPNMSGVPAVPQAPVANQTVNLLEPTTRRYPQRERKKPNRLDL